MEPIILGGYAAKQCAHRANNDVALDPSLAEGPGADALQRMEEGNDFEDEIGARLRALHGANGLFLEPDRVDDEGRRVEEDKKAREVATLEAMQAGVPLIWNARLEADKAGRRIAEPDFLVRGTKRADGRWSYFPGDVKHHKELTGTKASAWKVSEFCDPTFTASIETALVGTPHLSDAMQLAHYYRALQSVNHATDTDKVWGAIVGKEQRLVWVDIADTHWQKQNPDTLKREKVSALDYYDRNFAFRLKVTDTAQLIADTDGDVNPITRAVWKSECNECPWRTVCRDELTAEHDVSLLQGVTESFAEVHYAAGNTSWIDVSRLNGKTAVLVDAGIDVLEWIEIAKSGIYDPEMSAIEAFTTTGRKKREKAEALVAAQVATVGDVACLDARTAEYYELANGTNIKLAWTIDAARVMRAERVHLKRGVEKLDIPRGDIEVDIDMENDPATTGLIYLWGSLTTVSENSGIRLGERNNAYHADISINVEQDPDYDEDLEESRAFVSLWNWMQALLGLAGSTGKTVRFYCYSAAEERCMRSLARKHFGRPGIPTEADIDELVNSEHWVDLLKILKAQTVWPIESMSIKDVAKYAKFMWRDSEASGANSMLWFQEARKGETLEERQASLDRVVWYNDDDTAAMLHLRNWLERLNTARDVKNKLANVSSLRRRFERRRRQK